jgi:putative peptidoglycan lipid II flippase
MSRSLLRSTRVTGFNTLLSRITGLVRDQAITAAMGLGASSDTFLAVYAIPNFLRRLFAEGAFSQSFVPVLSEYRTQREPGDVRALVAETAGTLGLVLLVVTLIGVLAAPAIIYVYAGGFAAKGGDRFAMAVEMFRWVFPYLLFISLTSLYAGVLNSYQRFALPAFTQVLQNVLLIAVAIGIATHSSKPGLALAIGVFVSGVLQVVTLLFPVARLGLLSWPRWRPQAEGVRRILKLMVPGIVGSSMAQVSLLLNSAIASFLAVGSISALYLADRLMEFPLGVFSIALGTVILPSLSAQHANKDSAEFSDTLDWALRLTVLLVTPAMIGMLCFSGPMVAAVFGFRKVAASGTQGMQMASYALIAYSWGVMTFSLVKVLAPGYYARQDTRAPVRAALIALAVNVGLNVGIVVPAVWAGFQSPYLLLATSTCLSSAVNAFLLWRGLQKSGVFRPTHLWARLLPRVLIACAVMAAFLWWLSGDLAQWLAMPLWLRLAKCLGIIALAAALYFAVLFALGLRSGDLRHRAATA